MVFHDHAAPAIRSQEKTESDAGRRRAERPTFSDRLARLRHRLRNRPNVRPVAGYPSSIVDSQGCEFGYEMFYHVPYAHHLALQGRLEATVSCKGTRCFYFFSPDHREQYSSRRFIPQFHSIDQVPHARPDLSRWQPPDFRGHYRHRLEFGFRKPPLLIFNKFNVEWDHPPINFFSRHFLANVVDLLQAQYTIVYLRPTTHIIHDHMPIGEMDEKDELRRLGVVLGEELYEQHSQVSFNEFQLCLLAASDFRISVQGGAAYLNAMFPGRLMLFHRYGGEQLHGNYDDFTRLGVTDFTVFNDEFEMLHRLSRRAA